MLSNSKLLVLVLAALFVAASAFSLDLTRPSQAAQNGAVLVQGTRAYTQDVDKLLRRYDKLDRFPAGIIPFGERSSQPRSKKADGSFCQPSQADLTSR